MEAILKKPANTRLLSVTLSSVLLVACGGGGGGGSTANNGIDVSGTPVKGPMVNADVLAYRYSASGTLLKGSLLASGTTNAQANITGLRIPSDYSGPVIIEVQANQQTSDLNTGLTPAISVFRTVVASPDVLAAGPIYPSPLTSLAYELAVSNADSAAYGGDGDGSISDVEFSNAFGLASQKVLATLGFGLAIDIDLNTTPPLLTAATTSSAAQVQAITYRGAIEALSAILITMKDDAIANNAASQQTTDSLLAALAADLSDDVIDGAAGSEAISAFADIRDLLALVTVDPATLKVPGTEISIADIESVLVAEQSATGSAVDSSAIAAGTVTANPEPAKASPDVDADGVPDSIDNCVSVGNPEQGDLDEDGVGDVCDADRDGDDVANADDDFPNDASESVDTDQDGIGNNADLDDDGDEVPDVDDAFPLDESESVDSDNDGQGDNTDTDLDGDGVENSVDNCPVTANEDQADSDDDDVGDVCDTPDPQPSAAVWGSFNWDDANWQ